MPKFITSLGDDPIEKFKSLKLLHVSTAIIDGSSSDNVITEDCKSIIIKTNHLYISGSLTLNNNNHD